MFDEAFIPWENFLVYRDVERANAFYPASGFFNRYNLQSGTRLAVKLDFMTGLLARGLEMNGTSEFRGVQAALGEVVAWRTLLWTMTTAMARGAAARAGRLGDPARRLRRDAARVLDDGVAGREGDLRERARRRADRRAVGTRGSAEPGACAR